MPFNCPQCGHVGTVPSATEHAVGRAVAGWKLRTKIFSEDTSDKLEAAINMWLDQVGNRIVIQEMFPISHGYGANWNSSSLPQIQVTTGAPTYGSFSAYASQSVGILYMEI